MNFIIVAAIFQNANFQQEAAVSLLPSYDYRRLLPRMMVLYLHFILSLSFKKLLTRCQLNFALNISYKLIFLLFRHL